MARRTKEPKTKKGFSGRAIRLVVVVIAAYLLVTFVAGQMRVAEKQRELEEITTQAALREEQNRELERLMESGEEANYVERMAREKLGFARPNERVFVDLTGE